MDTMELTDEMRKRIEDVYVEADKLTTVIADATKRRDDLRGYLEKALASIGLKPGQGLQSERIIDMATVTTKIRSHVRFGQTSVLRSAYPYLGENANGVKAARFGGRFNQ